MGHAGCADLPLPIRGLTRITERAFWSSLWHIGNTGVPWNRVVLVEELRIRPERRVWMPSPLGGL